MHDTSLYAAAICVTRVNTQTHSFWPVILLAQPAEPENDDYDYNHDDDDNDA